MRRSTPSNHRRGAPFFADRPVEAMGSALLRRASAPLAALLARQRSAVLAAHQQQHQQQQRGAMAAAASTATAVVAPAAMATAATATTPPPPPAATATAHLNPEQLAAALSPARAVRVIAGPGSGKTATLTARCAALVQGTADGGASARVPPWRLLVITFTNKAAGELKRRLADSLGEESARQVAAGTFHSLAARLLRRYASRLAAEAAASSSSSSLPPRWAFLRPDFTVYDEADAQDVLERALKLLPLDPGRPKPAELRWQISQVKSHCPQGGYASRGKEAVPFAVNTSAPLARALASANTGGLDPRAAERLAEAYDAYASALDADGALDFDDLLGAAVTLLERAPGVRDELHQRWRHVLVDEFQDTNAPQYRLVRLLLSPHPDARLFCVGDPCQGVYSFRGADPRNLAAAFERDFGGAGGGCAAAAAASAASLGSGQGEGAVVATMALRRNHRSVDPIVRAAERVLCGCGLAPGLHSAAETVRGAGGGAGAPTRAPSHPLPPPNPAPGERYRVPISSNDTAASVLPLSPTFTAAPVTLVEAATGAGEVAAVVAAARRWRDAGEPLREFAVLYRYRAQARDLEEALAEAGVPCVVHGGTALWARREVRDALAMLRLAARAGGGGGGLELAGSGGPVQQQQAGDSQALRRVLTGIEGLALTLGLGPKAVAGLQQAADDAGASLAALVLEGCCGGGDGEEEASSLARLLWDDLSRAAAAACDEDAATPQQPPMLLDAADISARLERAAPPPPAPVAAALRTAPQRAAVARVRGLVAVVRAALEDKGGPPNSPFPLAPDEALELALHAAGYHAWLAALREKERRAAAAAGGSATSASASSSSSNGSRERSLGVLATLARNPETYEQAAEQELFFMGEEEEDPPSSLSPLPPWEEDGGDHGAAVAASSSSTTTPQPKTTVPRGLPGLVAFVDFAALMSDPHNDTPDDDGEEEEEEGEDDEDDEQARLVGDGARPRRRKSRSGNKFAAADDSRRRREREAVQLMTLHASKGREFAHVSMVAVEEGTLPALPPGEALPLRAGEDAWEEEKRLCYVGMTRARDYLMVSWARSRRAWGADGARLLRAAAAAAAASAAAADGGGSSSDSSSPPSRRPLQRSNPYAGGGGLVPVERSPFVVALLQGVKSGNLRGVDVVRAPSVSERGGGGSGGGGGGGGAKKWGGGGWKKKKQPQQQQRRGMSSSSSSSVAAAAPTPARSSRPPPPPPLPPLPGGGDRGSSIGDAGALPAPRRSARLRQQRQSSSDQQ
jgi:superfamily I DNA/RNA helicase